MKKKTESSDNRLKSALQALTWKKMKEWADPGSVERGRGYLDNVEEPRQYPDGSVIAKVHGSEDYYTRLHVDDDGKLQGDCTCPVGYRCKHAVALALVAIKKLKADEEMRRGATDDPLWKCAMSELAAWEPVEEDDDDDDDFGEEDFDDFEGDDESGKEENDIENPDDEVLAFLAGLDERRLRETVAELVKEVSEVRPYLQHKLDVARASIAQIAEMAREAINDASADWYDKYDKHGHNVVPDYSLVKEYFGILSASGHWQDLMKLGEILKRRSFRQIAESLHEYGEIRDQVCVCMDIVVEAVMRAGTQDPLDKLVWYEQLRSKDDYSVLEGMEKNFATSLETDRAGWSKVASYALDRYAKGGEGWELYLIRDVCLALERAGRVDEAVSRLRDNLRDDKNWIPLVEILERNGRRDEALKLCRTGISSRRDEAGSAVYKLREKIRLMTCDGDDGKLSVAYDLDEFLDSYWFDAAEYRALREKCERFNVWEHVHEFILRHLSTGCNLATEEGWPLPKTGTSTANDRIEGYPKLTLLIQIALEDGRPKDALAWYGQSVSGHGGICEYELDKLGWEVADAVVNCKPAEAVEIWLGYVHRNEREAGNSHYNQIGRAMQKLLPVMRSLGRLDEWRAEMSRLKESYGRRPNLMSILKDVESGSRSIDLLED
ncbi:MAG: SWIM zinc finger family protein [Kiritimatiellae bacterium]|nr:SWIM zinc finger family protein [Kiritimatiellia bacterium]